MFNRKTSFLPTLLSSLALATSLFACGTPDTDSSAQPLGQDDAPTVERRGRGKDDGGGQACSATVLCPAGQECEHGVCQAHGGGKDDARDPAQSDDVHQRRGRGKDDGGGQACSATVLCPAGQECEHGVCQAHGGHP